ncbi:hypothetical protein LZ32DRAFT_299251 [Colletotrichum eremochloae]|nr:hypothetical protein LZ32DRAFT_299251 [Colletotrichum eremochloae]
MSSNSRLPRRSAPKAKDKSSKVISGQRTVDSFFSLANSKKIESISSESSVPNPDPGRVPLSDATNTVNLPGRVETTEVVTSTVVVSSSTRSSIRSTSFGSEFHAGDVFFNSNTDQNTAIVDERSLCSVDSPLTLGSDVRGLSAASQPPADGPKSSEPTVIREQDKRNTKKKDEGVKPTNRDTWGHKTWLEITTSRSMEVLSNATEFFSQHRTESELTDFLKEIPEHSGWIHPLIPNFEKHRGKNVLLTILSCPKMLQRMNYDIPPPDPYAFTHALLLPIAQFIEETTGISSIAIDFRKECRRSDDHCAFLSRAEIMMLAAATQVELLVAKNVFDITFVHTIAWSRDVTKAGGGMDALSRAKPVLTGHIDRIPFHPRTFTFVGSEGQVSLTCFRALMYDHVLPIVSRLTGKPEQEIFQILLEVWKNAGNVLLRTVTVSTETKAFNIDSFPEMLETPRDLSKRTYNRPLLAKWAVLAMSEHAEMFATSGELPHWYLQQPRYIEATFGLKRVRSDATTSLDMSSVEEEVCAVRPTLDPSTEDTTVSARMIPNPVFDTDFIMSAEPVILSPYLTGLTGWETLAAREKKNERHKLARRTAKLEWTDAQREEARKKQKVHNDTRKQKMQDDEFRDRVNAERRLKRKAKKEIVGTWEGGALSFGSGA